MNPEQKAQRLEEMAAEMEACCTLCGPDAALLRESAAMWRERGAVRWEKVAGSTHRHIAVYRGWLLEIGKDDRAWNWSADSAKGFDEDEADTLEAAQAAAVAWVDAQEGKP